MSEYTPELGDLHAAYVDDRALFEETQNADKAFDRAIAKIEADALRETAEWLETFVSASSCRVGHHHASEGARRRGREGRVVSEHLMTSGQARQVSADFQRAGKDFDRKLESILRDDSDRYAASNAYRKYLVESGEYVRTRPARPVENNLARIADLIWQRFGPEEWAEFVRNNPGMPLRVKDLTVPEVHADEICARIFDPNRPT